MGNVILDFIKAETAKWGEEYVDDLMDRKYFPVLTSAGFRWLYISDDNYPSYVESALDTAVTV